MVCVLTGNVGRSAGQEKGPAVVLGTLGGQSLQIPQLAQWHAPERQDVLMEVICLLGRPPLKRRCIAGDGSKVAVVQPVDDRLFLLDPGPFDGFA